MPRNTLAMEALRVTVSHFCKARGVFRDACFERKPIGPDGETVSVLKKPPSGDSGADQLYYLLEFGVAECLDRTCLRSISLCIVRNRDNALLEELTLDCEAPRGSDYSQTSLSDAIRELTRKHRLLVQTLSPLPEDTAFKVRLTLIGAKMPYRAWTPPYFLSQREELKPSPQQFDGKPVTLKIGKFSSDTESCAVSIRSVLDTMDILTSTVESQKEPSQIAFDPVFTQVPSSSSSEEAAEESDVDLYQTIKTFVAADKTPSMKRAHDAHCHATMPSIRIYFQLMCDEGILVRRGSRFYPARPLSASTTDNRNLKVQAATRSTATNDHKRVDLVKLVTPPPSSHRFPAIAQLYQTYQATQHSKRKKDELLSVSTKFPVEGTPHTFAHGCEIPPRGEVTKISTKRYGRMVTAPIVQTTRPLRSTPDTCAMKFGRPVFVTSKVIIQTPQRPTHRRQKITIASKKA